MLSRTSESTLIAFRFWVYSSKGKILTQFPEFIGGFLQFGDGNVIPGPPTGRWIVAAGDGPDGWAIKI